MVDVVVTVPKDRWSAWIDEGDLPGEEARYESHFLFVGPVPAIEPGERVYVVAHGLVRGYAPLVRVEPRCGLMPYRRSCLVRAGGAEAVTPTCQRHKGFMSGILTCKAPGCIDGEAAFVGRDHPLAVKGFRGVFARWWPREIEMPFPDWRTAGVPGQLASPINQRVTEGQAE